MKAVVDIMPGPGLRTDGWTTLLGLVRRTRQMRQLGFPPSC